MSYYDQNDRDRADEREGPYLRFNAVCLDCGDRIEVRPLEIARCDRCLTDREQWTIEYKARMRKVSLPVADRLKDGAILPSVVEVALVPLTEGPIVEVALVPTLEHDLKRMARAVLAADLSTIQEVA